MHDPGQRKRGSESTRRQQGSESPRSLHEKFSTPRGLLRAALHYETRAKLPWRQGTSGQVRFNSNLWAPYWSWPFYKLEHGRRGDDAGVQDQIYDVEESTSRWGEARWSKARRGEARRDTQAPGLDPTPMDPLALLVSAFAQTLMVNDQEIAKEKVEHHETTATLRVAEEKTDVPRGLGMDLMAKQWRSSWGQYKSNNTRHHNCKYLLSFDCDCVHNLWDCLSPELRTAAYALSEDATIGEMQFLKEVRKLVVTNTSHVYHDCSWGGLGWENCHQDPLYSESWNRGGVGQDPLGWGQCH